MILVLISGVCLLIAGALKLNTYIDSLQTKASVEYVRGFYAGMGKALKIFKNNCSKEGEIAPRSNEDIIKETTKEIDALIYSLVKEAMFKEHN